MNLYSFFLKRKSLFFQQYFILLNEYIHSGPYNWSLQLLFDLDVNVVIDPDAGPSLPLIRDQWTQVYVEINFGTNLQTVFYQGQHLVTKSWTEGVGGGGALNLAAIDLFSDGGDTIYWDDLSVQQGPLATEEKTWGSIKALYRDR